MLLQTSGQDRTRLNLAPFLPEHSNFFLRVLTKSFKVPAELQAEFCHVPPFSKNQLWGANFMPHLFYGNRVLSTAFAIEHGVLEFVDGFQREF